MKVRKVTALLLALICLSQSALGALSPLAVWLKSYNDKAAVFGAPKISMDDLIVEDENGLCEFKVDNSIYLILYMDERQQPQGVFAEGMLKDAKVKNMFLASLLASDEGLTEADALSAFSEENLIYKTEDGGEYCYQTIGKWILIFSNGYEDGTLEMFAAITQEAYMGILGETMPGVVPSDGNENAEPEETPQPEPENGGDSAPEQTPSAPQPTPSPEKKIYKL